MSTEQPDQPSPEEERPKKRRSRTASTRRGSGGHPEANEEQPRAKDEQPQVLEKQVQPQAGTESGPSSGVSPDLSNLLELQIAEAIQPVLADFRQQMAQAVQQEMEHALATDGRGSGHQAEQSVRLRSAEQELPAPTQSGREETAEGQPTQQAKEAQAQPEAQEEQEGLQGLLSRRLGPLPAAALRGLEQQGQQWLESMLVAGLTALFAESTRTATQERAEQGLRALLQRSFDALPENPAKRELQQQMERTLQVILREVLDAIFTGDVRTEVQSHGKRATQALVHRNFEEALDQLHQASQVLFDTILAVLRGQWQRVLRLLLKVILTVLEDSLSSPEKSLPDLANGRGEEPGNRKQ